MISIRTARAVALRMFCAMLLVMLGFAHKPITASAATLPDVASYVLPDGTIASLCMPDHDEKPETHVDRRCEACRLAASFVLPEPPAEGERIARVTTDIIFGFAAASLPRLSFPPNAPPRGPPVAFPKV